MDALNINWEKKGSIKRVDASKVVCGMKAYSRIIIEGCDAILAMSYSNHRGTFRTVYFNKEDLQQFMDILNCSEII